MAYPINSKQLIVGVFLLCTAPSLVLSQEDDKIINCHEFAQSLVTKYGEEAKDYYWYPRCLAGGYYEHVQCDFYGCFCAYLDTGLPIPNTTTKALKSYMDENCPWETNKTRNVCSKPPNDYPCKETSKRFYLSSVTKKCEPSETSCLGFETEKACTEACVVETRNRCNFPRKEGKQCPRRKPQERWYHDEEKEDCRPFLYNGCGGNSNNYKEKWKCLKSCEQSLVTELIIQVHDTKYIVSLPTWLVVERLLIPSVVNKLSTKEFKAIADYMIEIARYVIEDDKKKETEEDKEKEKYRPKHASKNMTREEICGMKSDPGPCKSLIPRWYFNKTQSKCIRFFYGGCYGNENRHESAEGCAIFCDAKIKPSEDDILSDLFGLFGPFLDINNEKPKTTPGPARTLVFGGPPTLPTPTQIPEKNTTVTEVGLLGESEIERVFD